MLIRNHWSFGSSHRTSARQIGHTYKLNKELLSNSAEKISTIPSLNNKSSFGYLLDTKPSCDTGGMVDMLAWKNYLSIPSLIFLLANDTPGTTKIVILTGRNQDSKNVSIFNHCMAHIYCVYTSTRLV